MTSAGEALLHMETIKLLLQVAWADLEIEGREAGLILEKAKDLGLPPSSLSEIAGYLSGAQPLPPPDLQMLKGSKEAVIAAVVALLHADQRVSAEESEVLDTIKSLLGT